MLQLEPQHSFWIFIAKTCCLFWELFGGGEDGRLQNSEFPKLSDAPWIVVGAIF